MPTAANAGGFEANDPYASLPRPIYVGTASFEVHG